MAESPDYQPVLNKTARLPPIQSAGLIGLNAEGVRCFRCGPKSKVGAAQTQKPGLRRF